MPDVQFSLAKLYYRSGQIDRAQKEFEDLIASGVNSPEARTWLGILNYKLGKKGQARKLWEQAQSITPNDPAAKAYARLSRDWPVESDPAFG
jgi:tetratricopeptide (TPR) repeat protein